MSIFERDNYGNLLDFDAVTQHLYSICKEEKLDTENPQDLTKALMLFALQTRFENLTPDEAWNCIVDGPSDQGFDAIYIEEDDSGQHIVNIFQSKCYTTRRNILDKRFPADELDKLISKFEDFIVQRNFHEDANQKLQIKLDEIFGLENPKFRLIILTTSLPPPSNVSNRFLTKVNNYNRSREYVSAEYIGLSDLASYLPSVIPETVDLDLNLEGGYVESNSGRSRVIIGRAQGRFIAELVKKHGDKLFQKNVRGYLRQRNQVNQNIYATATNNDDAPYFFVLNNGITIVCDTLDYMSGQRSPLVKIKGGQIVNGGQTSNSLFEALRDGRLQSSVEVLVRIIETKDNSVLEHITEATNRQTGVSSRDLHSNDDIQKKIKSYIKDRYGFFFESRKNEMEGRVAIGQRIDAEKAAQAYYAYEREEPAVAKSSKSKLFNQYYEQIFDIDVQDLPEKLFFSYTLLKTLDNLKSDYSDRHSYSRDAQITTLALLKDNSSITNYKKYIEDQKKDFPVLKNDISRILNATRSIVEEDMKKLGDKFEKRILFITPSTFGRIQEVLDAKRS